MAEQRIQKILSEQGYCSRRQAETLISDGRVKVNGRPVSLGDKADAARDAISVDGERIRLERKVEKRYIMLHKPRGYVTTLSDELGRKCVADLVKGDGRLYPVGRLDRDSEGLLLMTNDGAFANRIAHPSGGISKLYRVTVHPKASEEQITALASGVVLDDGEKTLPAMVHVVVDEAVRTVMEITIKEGKNRQIRRMCEAVGLEVARLRRTAIGPLKLGMLRPGEYRELTKQELTALRNAVDR